jgi:hypothetical protein
MDILIIKPFINNKLYISGAETASINPGYMDGALNAAYYMPLNFKKQADEYRFFFRKIK